MNLKKAFLCFLILSSFAPEVLALPQTTANDNDCQCGWYGGLAVGTVPLLQVSLPNKTTDTYIKGRLGYVLDPNDRVLSLQGDVDFSRAFIQGAELVEFRVAPELKVSSDLGSRFYWYFFFGAGLDALHDQAYLDIPEGVGVEFFPNPTSNYFNLFFEINH